jgi:hypothetical protein
MFNAMLMNLYIVSTFVASAKQPCASVRDCGLN